MMMGEARKRESDLAGNPANVVARALLTTQEREGNEQWLSEKKFPTYNCVRVVLLLQTTTCSLHLPTTCRMCVCVCVIVQLEASSLF